MTTLVDEPVKQQDPLDVPLLARHKSQAGLTPFGSVSGKLTLIVLPTGASRGETVSVPTGGPPAVEEGKTVTYLRPKAPPPRLSATEMSYGTVVILATEGA